VAKRNDTYSNAAVQTLYPHSLKRASAGASPDNVEFDVQQYNETILSHAGAPQLFALLSLVDPRVRVTTQRTAALWFANYNGDT
jgi:hypothetical protein